MILGKVRRVGFALVVALALANLASAASVTVSPGSLSFGNQVLSTPSVVKVITLTNGQAKALKITSITSTLSDYTQSNTCPISPSTLAAGATCTISVTFTPAALGSRSATLNVNDDAIGSPQKVSLLGTGIAAVTATPASLSYGNQVIGKKSSSKTVTVTNNQSTSLSDTAISNVNRSALASTFAQGTATITAASDAINRSATMTVTAPTLVSLSVTPAIISVTKGATQQFIATGTYTDGSTQNLTTSANWSSSSGAARVRKGGLATAESLGSASITATFHKISGAAIMVSIQAGSVAAFPGPLTFPPQLSGTSSSFPQTASVYNLGSTAVTVTAVTVAPSVFQLVGGSVPVILAPGSYANFSLSFTPSSAGSFTGTVTFSFDSAASQSLPLLGTGTSTTASASLNASSLSFGNQPLGANGPSQTVSVTNVGTTALTVTGVTVTRPFLQTGFTSSTKVAPGSSFGFQIGFVPNFLGPVTGTALITFDLLKSQGISLAGTATTPGALGINTFPMLPTATQSSAYQTLLTATGGVGLNTWALNAGYSLPAGLSLSSAGLISGVLDDSVAAGNYSLGVQVSDSNTPPSTAAAVLTLPVGDLTGGACNNISWDAAGTSNLLVALSDLGASYYLGQYQGGLYANGSNLDDPNHHSYGLAAARTIQPLDANGVPNPSGKYVLLAVGHSNTSDAFAELQTLTSADPSRNPSLVVVNGAHGSASADVLQDPNSYFWGIITNDDLPNAGVTANQVTAVWLNDVDVSHPPTIPALQAMMENIVRNLLVKFPNLRIIYLSSINYTAYSNGVNNFQPEPSAYEAGFAMKAVIQDQVNGTGNLNYNPANGPVVAPWLDWGAYYWTNGLLGRSDGLAWSCQDAISDGAHPSDPAGRLKIATQLLNFLKTDDTTVGWFLAPPK